MTVKVPIRTVFTGGNATGLAEFQTGERVGIEHGGTGLASVGTAGQVLAVNANTDGLEYVDSDTLLINDRMQVANTQALHSSVTANLNSYIANTNPRIGNLLTSVSGTNTAIRALVTTESGRIDNVLTSISGTNTSIRTLVSDRMQVANTIALANARLGATASVTLSGDVSGSASFSSNAVSITTTIADDSHNHIIGNVDGLQAALDNRMTVANTQALANARLGSTASVTLSGDVSGSASFSGNSVSITTTVADDSHNHIIGNVDGLQAALDNRMTVANTQTLVGDRLGATATVQITGDVAGGPTAFSGNTVSIAVTQQNNSVDLGTHTTGNYVATIAGTANEVEVSGSGSETAAVTIGLPDNVTVTGDLTVSGGDITLGGTGRIQGVDTVSAGTDAANKTYVDNAVAGVVDSAPAALDTLNELAAALGDDANFATTVSTNIGQKLGATATVTLTGDITGSASFSANAVSIATTYNNDVVLGTDTSGNYVATITGGTGIDSSAATSGEGTTHTLSLDLNELATSTTNTDGDYFVVVDSADGSQHKLTKGNINISGFNNDSGFTTNVGDITNVTAGTGLSGGGASGSVTLALDMSELTDMTATMIGTDEFIVLDGGADRRKAANEIGLSIFNNDAGFSTTTGTVTSIATGGGLTGGTITGSGTISHADTSSQASVNNSGRTYIQDITLDTYGHVTSIASATETVTDTNTTYSAGAGLDLSGTTFSVESDLRGDVTYIGVDTNDYYRIQGTVHDWYLDGVLDMRLENDGDLHIDGDMYSSSTITSSDIKLKENIEVVENAVEKINQLRGVEFNWKKNGNRSAGVIAQDVEKVLPQAVKEVEDLNGDDTYLSVNYDALHALTIEAIKTMSDEIANLKAEIEELKKS